MNIINVWILLEPLTNVLCVQAVTAKGRPNLEEQERNKQLSSYKQCYTYKNQSLEVSKYMNLALIVCNKLDARG